MSSVLESEIIAAEEKLRVAMLNSDTGILDELMSSELIFTNHLGHLLTKQDDIAAHTSGLLTLVELTPSEQRIHMSSGIAIVSVRMQLSGSYAGMKTAGDFRFTRVWSLSPSGNWQIIVANACLVQ